jgi:PD-(D/E)XK endonuclease
MRRKANRMAGGKLAGCKERGEWAELYFMMMAAGLGMKVSRPFGPAGRYDVGVENPRVGCHARVLRVQVKSTIYTRRGGGYSLNVTAQRKKYEPGTVDYFAILLIPRDDWYIIPFEVMGRTNYSLHFTPTAKLQKYGDYFEAWHLLKQTGLTIQACCDPEWEQVATENLESAAP